MNISVLVPVRKDDRLIACLDSLAQQNFPKYDYQVVVVENDENPKYRSIVESYGYEYIQEKEAGIGRALRKGQSYCVNDIIARTDADCVLPTTWLQTIDNTFTSDPRLGVIGGPIPKYKTETWVEKHQRTLAQDTQYALQYLPHITPLPYLVGANIAFRSKDFWEAGGFDEIFDSGSDVDICWRIQRCGYKIQHVPDLIVYHHCRKEVKNYLLAFQNYAIGHALLLKKHGPFYNRYASFNWYPKKLLLKTLFFQLPFGLVVYLTRKEAHLLGTGFFDLLESFGLLSGSIRGSLRYKILYL